MDQRYGINIQKYQQIHNYYQCRRHVLPDWVKSSDPIPIPIGDSVRMDVAPPCKSTHLLNRSVTHNG